jgi:hypothetical protein
MTAPASKPPLADDGRRPDAAGDHAGGGDGEHDEELADFVRGGAARRGVHPVRFVLAAAAMIAVGTVLLPTTDELAFHLSRQATPVDLGDAPPAVLARVPDGTWVRATVVLGNKAAEIPEWRKGSLRFGPIEVREVVGAPLVIELDPRTHPGLDPFVQAEVEGRLVSFADDSELGEVRRYFVDRLHARVAPHARAIIVGEKPGGLSLYLTAWIGGVALVVLSVGSIVRRLRGG